jgi:hypothetical protein
MDDNTPRGETGRLDSAKETIRAKAADLASNAKEQASKQFDSKVGVATSEIGSIASALRRAGDELRSANGSSMGATVISLIADRLETVGGSIGGRDLNGTIDDIERLARRNPAAFMGTAAALGFLAARFLKSSSPGWSASHDEQLAPLHHSPDYELYRGRDIASTGYGTGVSGSMGYGSGARPTSDFGAGAGTSATGWDAPAPAGSGLTGTAEGIDTPARGTTNRGPRNGGSGSGSGGI